MLALPAPIDATLDVFGEVIDSYTMTESVQDEITVRIVYEGRAAKVILDSSKLEEVESITKSAQTQAPMSGKSTKAKSHRHHECGSG